MGHMRFFFSPMFMAWIYSASHHKMSTKTKEKCYTNRTIVCAPSMQKKSCSSSNILFNLLWHASLHTGCLQLTLVSNFSICICDYVTQFVSLPFLRCLYLCACAYVCKCTNKYSYVNAVHLLGRIFLCWKFLFHLCDLVYFGSNRGNLCSKVYA